MALTEVAIRNAKSGAKAVKLADVGQIEKNGKLERACRTLTGTVFRYAVAIARLASD